MAAAERDAEMKEITLITQITLSFPEIFCIAHILCYVHFSLGMFLNFLIFVLVMHAVLCWATSCVQWFCLLLRFRYFITVKKWHWVLLLYATIIASVVVETFPFVWTLPVSSRCHFAFHPHPLVRISAALLWVSVGEYRSLWVLVCNVICACSNTSAHCVVLSSTAA